MKLFEIYEAAEFQKSKISSISRDNSRSYAYHATSVNNSLPILLGNAIHARTAHEINGKIYKGISLSRDKLFSTKWNEVTFCLDLNKIKQNHKVNPIDVKSYNTSLRLSPREGAEEFIIGDLENLSDYLVSVIFRKDVIKHRSYARLEDILFNNFQGVVHILE